MRTTTNNPLSDTQATQFFAAPEATRQRQYEALRAYFVEGLLVKLGLDRLSTEAGLPGTKAIPAAHALEYPSTLSRSSSGTPRSR